MKLNQKETDQLTDLAAAGLCASFCYGPMGSKGSEAPVIGWSVDVLRPATGQSFDLPFQARDLTHAIEIAHIEARARGWIVVPERN